MRETDIGGSVGSIGSVSASRFGGRTPLRRGSTQSLQDLASSYPPLTPHRHHAKGDHMPTHRGVTTTSSSRPTSRGSGMLSTSTAQRWKLATAATVAALRSNAVAPEVAADAEGLSRPVEFSVRPQKLPPLLQPTTSGEQKSILKTTDDMGQKDRMKEVLTVTSSSESLVVPLSDTESPDVRRMREAPLSPSKSPSHFQGKSVINFGLARKHRQRYTSHVSGEETSDANAEEGQSPALTPGALHGGLPRVSEMLSSKHLKAEAKKHVAAKKNANEKWDNSEEGEPVDHWLPTLWLLRWRLGAAATLSRRRLSFDAWLLGGPVTFTIAEEKLNQAGHKLINPEKHLHVHPVFRPKQYSFPDLLRCFPVILPNSKFVESFDFVMSFLLVYIAMIAPVDTAFLEPKMDALFVFNRTIDGFFFVDFIVQFNLATPSACLLPLTPLYPRV